MNLSVILKFKLIANNFIFLLKHRSFISSGYKCNWKGLTYVCTSHHYVDGLFSGFALNFAK